MTNNAEAVAYAIRHGLAQCSMEEISGLLRSTAHGSASRLRRILLIHGNNDPSLRALWEEASLPLGQWA